MIHLQIMELTFQLNTIERYERIRELESFPKNCNLKNQQNQKCNTKANEAFYLRLVIAFTSVAFRKTI